VQKRLTELDNHLVSSKILQKLFFIFRNKHTLLLSELFYDHEPQNNKDHITAAAISALVRLNISDKRLWQNLQLFYQKSVITQYKVLVSQRQSIDFIASEGHTSVLW